MNHQRLSKKSAEKFKLALFIISMACSMPLMAGAANEFLVVDHITCWPNLTLLPNGKILLAGFDKPSHGQMEGDVSCWLSADEGKSWKFQGTLTQHDPNTVRMNHAVGLTKEGNLVTLVSGWSDIQQPRSPKRSVLRDKVLGSWVCQSRDDGKTWTVTKDDFQTDPNGRELIPFGDIFLTEDGSLGVSMYSTSYWDKPGPWAAFFVVSEDDGKMWHIKSEIAPDINETALLYLGKGQWLAAARGTSILLYRSNDYGKTWTLKESVTAKSQVPGHLLKLKDGRIVMTYGDRRKDHFGVGARISDDEGETWGQPLVLASMPSSDGGYPASVQLPDGRILTVYYTKKGDLNDYTVLGTIWQAKKSEQIDPQLSSAKSKTVSDRTFVVACDDAGAGGHEGMPDVFRCRSGQLLCVFYAGYGHGSKPNAQLPQGGRICYIFSGDEGESWSKPKMLCDTPMDDRGPQVFQLDNGRLICTFFTSYPETIWRGTYACYSDDEGQTWSQPEKIVEGYYAEAPTRKLSTGRWIMPLYKQDRKTGAQGAAMFSDDQCRTWSKVMDIPTGVPLSAETDVIELTDGGIYAIQRGPTAYWSVSYDGGLHWNVSKPLDFAVIAPYLIRAKNGIVVMAYGQRIDGRRWGTALRYSMDECKTWSAPEVVDDVLGSHPSMVNLVDGSVLVMYYDERSGEKPSERSDIRARRFTVSNQGIKWLPID